MGNGRTKRGVKNGTFVELDRKNPPLQTKGGAPSSSGGVGFTWTEKYRLKPVLRCWEITGDGKVHCAGAKGCVNFAA